MPNDVPPIGYKHKGFCNEDLDCKCYYPGFECEENELCRGENGICATPGSMTDTHVPIFSCNQEVGESITGSLDIQCMCHLPYHTVMSKVWGDIEAFVQEMVNEINMKKAELGLQDPSYFEKSNPGGSYGGICSYFPYAFI